MSVHKIIRNGQPRWIVRWRENSQQRSRTFTARKDAREYDAVLGRLRAQGELADELQRRRVTLADAVAHWWDTHAHALTSADVYAVQLDHRVLPQLGSLRVTQLTVAVVEEWIAWMRARGDGDATIVKACTVLQSVLAVSVRDGVLASNPVAAARKPSQARKRTPLLIRPDQVEIMRAHFVDRGRERDVVLLELLAYAGLRPQSEAITLTWRGVRDRSLLIRDTKRGRERSVPLIPTLAQTLSEWRRRTGAGKLTSIVAPTAAGPWSTKRLAQLASACLPPGRRRRRAPARRAPSRPARQLREPARPRRPQHRRGRPHPRARPRDLPARLRPGLRRARPADRMPAEQVIAAARQNLMFHQSSTEVTAV